MRRPARTQEKPGYHREQQAVHDEFEQRMKGAETDMAGDPYEQAQRAQLCPRSMNTPQTIARRRIRTIGVVSSARGVLSSLA
jgi:hypothetical protein